MEPISPIFQYCFAPTHQSSFRFRNAQKKIFLFVRFSFFLFFCSRAKLVKLILYAVVFCDGCGLGIEMNNDEEINVRT